MFLKSEIKLLENVCNLCGVSGQEHYVAAFLKKEYEKLGFELLYDNLGSIYAYKKSKVSNPKKVLIDAHMDEIGLMCISIDSNGLIKAARVGGVNDETFYGNRVVLVTRDGKKLVGVGNISSSNSSIDVTKMKFDFGFKNEKEAYDAGVYIGAMMVGVGEFVVLNNGQRLLSKAFDDRYGIALGLEILKFFKNKDLPYDLYVGGSVQEEVGLRGAKTISNVIKPDLAICLDCSPARELDGDQGALGQGVLIRYFDRSMIAFPKLLQLQEKACQKAKVKYQYFQSPGGTNAGQVHLYGDGVLTLTHCICARNLHTPSTIIDADDYHAAKKSLICLLKMLNDKMFAKLSKN